MSHIPQLDGLKIEEQVHKADATRRTQRGDKISVHYRGTLTNGTEFDASYKRGTPLDFTVGAGQVIKGWDEGLLNMAEGEKRKLTIDPALGYGASGAAGVIPPNATLIFETELVKINDKKQGSCSVM